MLRYMDILSELKQTSGHEAVKELTKEQEQLLEKSGLTNDEMEEFIKLNGEIIERAPETEKAISDQGNAYALTAEDRKSTRLNSSHVAISYAVFCLKKKNIQYVD